LFFSFDISSKTNDPARGRDGEPPAIVPVVFLPGAEKEMLR